MKCPKCGTTEDIKFFLRHQAEDENDTSNNANVITILCSKCGKNESYFLKDCLEDIFPAWKEVETISELEALAGLFNSEYDDSEWPHLMQIPQDDFNFDDVIEEPATEED